MKNVSPADPAVGLNAPASAPRRALIVEECLRDESGHYASFVLGLAGRLRERGMAVEVWAHRGVSARLGGAGIRVRPVFASNWIQELWQSSRWRRAALVVTHNLRFFAALRRAGRGEAPWTVVFATDANIFHFAAWRLWLTFQPRATRLVLITIQPPGLYDYEDGRLRLKPQARFYRWILRSLAGPIREGRCLLAADTAHNCRLLETCSGHRVRELPVPRSPELLTALAPPPGPALRLGLLGRPTPDKGFDRMVVAIERWITREPPGGGAVCFVVQWQMAPGCDPAELRRLEALAAAAPGRIELIRELIDEAGYSALVASLHGGILPYQRDAYRGRGSSVALDLMCAGRPFICTAGTWSAEKMETLGAGVLCEEEPDSIVAAIATLVGDYEALAARALGRASLAREAFSWSRFFAQLDLAADDLAGDRPLDRTSIV